MFDRRNLLRFAVPVVRHPDESVQRIIYDTLSHLAENIARPRNMLPFKLFRGARDTDLSHLAQAMREYHELGASGCGLSALDRLSSDARPFIYPLKRGTVQGLECDRVALAGAYCPGDSAAAAFVTVMTWSVLHDNPGVLHDVDLWEWSAYEPEERLVGRLEQLYRETEQPQDKIWRSQWTPDEALTLMSAEIRGELPHEFAIYAQSVAAGVGLRLHVPNDIAAANNLISSGHGTGIQVYVGWARFEKYNHVPRVRDYFDKIAKEPKAVARLVAYQPEDALAELRRQLERIVADWKRPQHRGILNPDGWYYLQKRGGGGGRDEFDPRAGPCKHDSWFTAGSKAPQARKGVYDFFGSDPDELQGCNECHCYRARFNSP